MVFRPIPVLNSDLWVEKICDSAYFDKVFTDLIPAMTSATLPKGKASCSSMDNSFNNTKYPYYAFDKNESTMWESATVNSDEWLMYQFDCQKKICFAKIYHSYTDTINNSELQYSIDGKTFNKLCDINVATQAGIKEWTTLKFNKCINALYIRVYRTTSASATLRVNELQIYGK